MVGDNVCYDEDMGIVNHRNFDQVYANYRGVYMVMVNETNDKNGKVGQHEPALSVDVHQIPNTKIRTKVSAFMDKGSHDNELCILHCFSTVNYCVKGKARLKPFSRTYSVALANSKSCCQQN